MEIVIYKEGTPHMPRLTGFLRCVLPVTAVFGLSACETVVLSPAGDIAARQKDLLLASTLLMLVIIIPVMALTVFFAWKYRAQNKARYAPDWDHSTKFELVIWAAPLLIIICLGAMTWVGTHLLDPYRPLDRISASEPIAQDSKPLKVQVVALDWKWLFIYPEYGIATVNELAAPVDQEIEFTLTSSSVMNSFYIPAMAGMIYAMPGMETKLHGIFNESGEYQGLASHYSGWGFSGMRFKAHALDDAGFDEWLDKVKAGGDELTREAYLKLEVPSENVAPKYYANVAPNLFARAVNMCVEEGKMCMAEMMAIDDEGGLGLAGIINVRSLTYDKDARRGVKTALGNELPTVASICSPKDLDAMLAQSDDKPRKRADLTPMNSHGLPLPDGLFQQIPTGYAESRTAGTLEQNF